METLLRIGERLDAVVTAIGRVAAWAVVILIAITIFDVVTRRFFVLGSTKLQELEWHFHFILFILCLGYAYMRDAHVRIDLLRDRFPTRRKVWIELIGSLFALTLYAAIMIHFAIGFAVDSFVGDEVSASGTGLGQRWIIKSFLPLGLTILALAGVSMALRCIVFLFGPADLAERARPHGAPAPDAGGR